MSNEIRIELMQATPNPLDLISLAAGCCYGKSDVNHKRVRRCVRDGHTSVLEHAVVTLKVEGISRACLAQLTRHRIGVSPSVESQRYCVTGGDDWYVTPPSIGDIEVYHDFMAKCHEEYSEAIQYGGIKAEDARYMLPNAAKTKLFLTFNARSLLHFMHLRLDEHAQWEIRELAEMVCDVVSGVDEQWKTLLDWGVNGVPE